MFKLSKIIITLLLALFVFINELLAKENTIAVLNKKNRIQILSNYNEIIRLLGNAGASKRAAIAINSLN